LFCALCAACEQRIGQYERDCRSSILRGVRHPVSLGAAARGRGDKGAASAVTENLRGSYSSIGPAVSALE
jgi:hypothetical protein